MDIDMKHYGILGTCTVRHKQEGMQDFPCQTCDKLQWQLPVVRGLLQRQQSGIDKALNFTFCLIKDA